MTQEEYDNLIARRQRAGTGGHVQPMVKAPAKGRSKYGNKKVVVDGIVFDSKREAVRYQTLRTMERGGEIQELKRQVPFVLIPKLLVGGEKTRPVKYIADFTYLDQGQLVVEDTKGFRTDTYKLKRIMMKHLLGIEIHET